MTPLFEFISANAKADPAKLLLKYRGADLGFDLDFAVVQIEARRKFAAKLADTLSRDPHFLFPSLLAGEQATSDLFARFHASLVAPGASVCDLTAGLGIDVFHIARAAIKTIAIELDPERFNILKYNAERLAPSVITIHADCREFLRGFSGKNIDSPFDVIFIDPARRAADGSRVYALAQCAPDVTALMPDIRQIARKLIVKLSPMLDISKLIADLRAAVDSPCSVDVMAVGTPGECRELVAIVDFGNEAPSQIQAVTLRDNRPPQTFVFTPEEETAAIPTYGLPTPGDYLIEPYAAVMKTAPWRLFAQRYNLKSVAPNSHVYFSETLPEAIPAATLQIIDVIPYSSSNIKRLRKTYPKAMIACRNFDIPASTLRAKLKISEGDDLRILATKDIHDTPFLLIAHPKRSQIRNNKLSLF